MSSSILLHATPRRVPMFALYAFEPNHNNRVASEAGASPYSYTLPKIEGPDTRETEFLMSITRLLIEHHLHLYKALTSETVK